RLWRPRRPTPFPYTPLFRSLGNDRETVSRLLEEGSTRRYQRAAQPQRPSKLDPYKEYILKRVLEDEVTNAQVILREIRSLGYEGDRKSTRLNSSHVKISYAV